jgi:hypothetical protein
MADWYRANASQFPSDVQANLRESSRYALESAYIGLLSPLWAATATIWETGMVEVIVSSAVTNQVPEVTEHHISGAEQLPPILDGLLQLFTDETAEG